MNQSQLIGIFLGALALTGGIGVLQATEEIADSEKLECAVCHEPPDSELLTDRGKYYELMRSLEGFESVIEKFESCSYCHAREPGSDELTRDGVRFDWMMRDMKGLRAWLDEYHPWNPEERQSQDSDEKDGDGDPPPNGP